MPVLAEPNGPLGDRLHLEGPPPRLSGHIKEN